MNDQLLAELRRLRAQQPANLGRPVLHRAPNAPGTPRWEWSVKAQDFVRIDKEIR